MAYREVDMSEAREVVLRLRAKEPIKRIASELGIGRNTVRRYRKKANGLGLLDGGSLPDAVEFARRWRGGDRVVPPQAVSRSPCPRRPPDRHRRALLQNRPRQS